MFVFINFIMIFLIHCKDKITVVGLTPSNVSVTARIYSGIPKTAAKGTGTKGTVASRPGCVALLL